jgi:hypothetical protein
MQGTAARKGLTAVRNCADPEMVDAVCNNLLGGTSVPCKGTTPCEVFHKRLDDEVPSHYGGGMEMRTVHIDVAEVKHNRVSP